MIVFVGDQPSKKNVDPNTAFVGTKSYKRLLGWIYELNLSLNEVLICNKDDIKDFYNNGFYVETPQMNFEALLGYDKVIALGKNSQKFLQGNNIEYLAMDHPSGLNRKLNCEKYEKQMLKECKAWINKN